jgi:hypothetical protein
MIIKLHNPVLSLYSLDGVEHRGIFGTGRIPYNCIVQSSVLWHWRTRVVNGVPQWDSLIVVPGRRWWTVVSTRRSSTRSHGRSANCVELHTRARSQSRHSHWTHRRNSIGNTVWRPQLSSTSPSLPNQCPQSIRPADCENCSLIPDKN